jgi:hypothetical protein
MTPPHRGSLAMMPTTLSLAAVIAACSVVVGAGARHGQAETWTRGANAVLQVDLTLFNQSVTVGEMAAHNCVRHTTLRTSHHAKCRAHAACHRCTHDSRPSRRSLRTCQFTWLLCTQPGTHVTHTPCSSCSTHGMRAHLQCSHVRGAVCASAFWQVSVNNAQSFATSNPRDTASNDINSTHHCLKQVAFNGCSRSHPLSTVMASGSRCRQQHYLRPRRAGRTALSARTTLWQWCGRQAKAVLIVESCTVLPTRC